MANLSIADDEGSRKLADGSNKPNDTSPLPLTAALHNNAIESLRQEVLGKLDGQANKIRALQSSTDKLQSMNDELTSKLKKFNAELTSEIEGLTSSYAELTSKVDGLMSSNTELLMSNAELTLSYAELTLSYAELTSRVDGFALSDVELWEKVHELVASDTEMSTMLQVNDFWLDAAERAILAKTGEKHQSRVLSA